MILIVSRQISFTSLQAGSLLLFNTPNYILDEDKPGDHNVVQTVAANSIYRHTSFSLLRERIH
jgi:hypothetical protein